MFISLVAYPVSPGIFGRVFQANRVSLLQVQTRTMPAKFNPGFVIGARGEFLFGLRSGKKRRALQVRTSSGGWVLADILAENATLGLGLGRIRGYRPGRFVPLVIGVNESLKAEDWLVVMSHDEGGIPEPFAGTLRSHVGAQSDNKYLQLDIPGQKGSPVLSMTGKLVGVIYGPGRRKTKAWPVETIIKFLKGVQLEP